MHSPSEASALSCWPTYLLWPGMARASASYTALRACWKKSSSTQEATSCTRCVSGKDMSAMLRKGYMGQACGAPSTLLYCKSFFAPV